jgi:Calcineurin-like phosphoesterase
MLHTPCSPLDKRFDSATLATLADGCRGRGYPAIGLVLGSIVLPGGGRVRYKLLFLGTVVTAVLVLAGEAFASPGDPVLVGAGDIARCGSLADAESTAKLLDVIPGTVFTAGDNAQDTGAASDYANCYGPTWGRHLARTNPVPGNHDYMTNNTNYFNYFGAAAHGPNGYYSYDLGGWHIVALNGNCSQVGGCGAGSPEEAWLRADLAAHPVACTLAYWHQPRFSTGSLHGNDTTYTAFWQALYDYGADIVINGHDHDYERFAPQDPNGNADPLHGIREFVAGTGGAGTRATSKPFLPTTEVRNDNTLGVIKLTLHPTSYDWQFVPAAGGTFTDSGSDTFRTLGPAPVGGSAQTPSLENSSETNGQGPFQSANLEIVSVIAAFATVLLLAAGTWYTRRRWLK